MRSKHVEAWNKLIVKQKFCASSWLITEIKKNGICCYTNVTTSTDRRKSCSAVAVSVLLKSWNRRHMMRCRTEFHKKKKGHSTAVKEGHSEVQSNLLCSFECKRPTTLPIHWTFSTAPCKNSGQIYKNPLKLHRGNAWFLMQEKCRADSR